VHTSQSQLQVALLPAGGHRHAPGRSPSTATGAKARPTELRQDLDDPDLPVDIELRPGRRSGSRGLR
jgi:hypothetical protein